MKLKIDTHYECLGICNERYVPGGYHDPLQLDNQLEIISKIKDITGIFISYPPKQLPADPEKLVKKLSNYNLIISNVLSIPLWDNKIWKHGAYSTNEKKIRSKAIELFKESIDFAKEVKAHSVLLWPAHDGFDYPFQVDYYNSWKNLKETIKEIGEYDKSAKIAIEYKSKDPRQKQLISNIGKAMMLINEIELKNVGVALDTGHAFMAQESIAESLAILDSKNKLFQIHLNENYRDSDPDLIFGTINFWENLEFFYYLIKTNYDGWLTIDMVSPRDDRIKSLKLATMLIKRYFEMANKLIKYSEKIDENLKNYCFSDNINLISELLFD
jgi:xylose isomerase